MFSPLQLPNAMPSPSALVVLSSGIGNVVRWTPLVTILKGSGCRVHVHLQSVDYPEVADLLLGAPGVDDLTAGWMPRGFDLACISHWAKESDGQLFADLAGCVDRMPDELWRQVGDPGAMIWHAAQMGWAKPIPAPFVRKSDRDFALPNGTIAIHAGCNPHSPWKRYPHFPSVADRFESVVLVGTTEDRIPEAWPGNVRDWSGQLSLLDTAALLSQCAALISNDSGLSHVGAALGIPTFPIYGATRCSREAMPLPNVYPLANRTDCDAVCASLKYGRCVARPSVPICLRYLDPDTVADYVSNRVLVRGVAA